ncbi:hypothetical protein Sme01_24330 [Sphaerisporangium melleum]|uniref:Uncharacterized protein n=1 Tax=Sphaerisporangium melleum TaxID=321316 RepID=A0A917QRY4_9ACTN|nr:choice-of-anchor L domain-containing protein [Sphaerisporangium melleum]GGK65432.1 hypothetical protein GCM10007964_05600 [Sphaerisporangium melleum]GII69957.1 hypothetical protein Sme01_24330 [Sphaerisporangium melleum]
MRRRFLLVMLAVVLAGTGASVPAFADSGEPNPPDSSPSSSPPPERHTISPGFPGGDKTARERAAKARQTREAQSRSVTTLDVDAGSVTPVGTGTDAALALGRALVPDSSLAGAKYVTTPPTSGTNGVAVGVAGVSGTSVLLTTGDATLAPQPNEFHSSGRDSGGGKVRGDSAYDVTVLQVDLDVPAGVSCLTFEVKYLTEEFPEFVRTAYNDGFVAELDRTTWATNDSTISAPDNFAYDPSGNVISTNTTGRLAMTASAAAGSTYDGATPMMRAATPITGGAHKLYLSIFDQHDAVYDSAALVRNLRYTQDEEADCGGGAKPATKPVVFVPGILGSKLVDETAEWWPGGSKLLSPTDAHLDNIMLNDDGKTDANGNGVYAPEVLMNVLGAVPIYSKAVSLLQGHGYVLGDIDNPQPGENLFLNPVDWRKSANDNAGRLLDRIEEIRQVTGAERVNIIAHSQGGLVTLAAVRMQRSFGKINRIATIGTPYLGAAKALGVMHYKTPCVIDILTRCLINRNEAAKITRNFPGFLELLPSDDYFDVVQPPVNRVPGGPLTPDQVRDMLSDKNLALIDQARAWHRAADRWDPVDGRIGLTRLVGTGVTTPVSFDEVDEEQCDEKHGWWKKCTKGKGVTINWSDQGDGTVPLGSARLTPELRGNTGTPEEYPGVKHQALPNTAQVMDMAVNSIQGDGPTGTLAPQKQEAEPVQAAAAAGGLTGTEIMIRGPVNLLLTDAAGRRTGFTDPSTEIELEDIPGSTYGAGTGPYKHISAFLTQGKAKATITATDFGYVYVRLRSYVNGVITSTIPYAPILIATGDHITLNGEGVTVPVSRVSVTPCDAGCPAEDPLPTVTGSAADDETPPNTTVTLDYDQLDGRKRVHIDAGATDSGGAGVERIEWAIESSDPDEPTQYQKYGLPFYWMKPTGSTATWTLHLRSIDKAGNIDGSYLKTPLNL